MIVLIYISVGCAYYLLNLNNNKPKYQTDHIQSAILCSMFWPYFLYKGVHK